MDGEGSKIRLVRCPNCENLLPELHDFSLYKCGGCGAVLRAKKQGSGSDDLSEKSEEEKGKDVLEKEKHSCDNPINLIDSPLSKAQDKVYVKAINQSSKLETMNLTRKQAKQKGDVTSIDDRYNPYIRGQLDHRVLKHGHVADAKTEIPTSSYPHEGSSNHRSSFPHGFGVHKRMENLDDDRAELLRKIEELKIQLGSCGDAREKPRDMGPIHKPMDSQSYVCNSYVPEGPYRANLQSFATNRDYKHAHGLNMGNIYPLNGVVRSSSQQPYYDQFWRHTMEPNQNNFASRNCEGSLYRPHCSCFKCYRNWQVQPPLQQTTLRSTHHHISTGSHHLHGHNVVSSTGLHIDKGGLNGGLVRRIVIAHGAKRICHPRAGGAPFLACPSCFVLLNLPINLNKGCKNGKKVRCGICSELISVEVNRNGLVITFPTRLEQGSGEDDVGYGEALLEDFSDDDLELNECVKSTVNSQSTVSSSSSSKRFTEDEPSPDSVIVVRENSKSADLALKDDSPLPEDSKSGYLASKDDPHHPQNIEPDDDYADVVFSRCGMGSKSKRVSRQNSVKDVQMVTEKEVVYNDVAVSEEVSEEEDQPRFNEVSESFFRGLFKKSFKDLLGTKQSVDMSRVNVFVNGKPLSNRVVKRAEKLAGPIHPGNYWYDYRAGFWGVMGQPCHGIIPPFIEEFNYSMPTKCGAGNTGVFVNGRELHESDLELLASRGLSTTRDKFYMVEISGRVVDEYTGEELDDLGNLAPTVEKVKHGFGMRPRAISE